MRTRIIEYSWGHMACEIHIQILIIEIEEYGVGEI